MALTPPCVEYTGTVYDMPFEEYHAVDAVGSSALRTLARSPWHYRNRVPTVPTRPMLRGTLAHCAVLEPDAMATRYAVVPIDAPRRPTEAQWNAKKSNEDSLAAKAWWSLFTANCAGREIISHAEYAITEMQLAAIRAEPTIAELFERGRGEVSVFWTDKTTGIRCKARPDWVHQINDREVELVDLKTTADESPRGFGIAAARLQMHLQHAHYVEGFEQATMLKVARFVFATVTNAPPVLAVPYMLTDELVEQGRDERRELLDRLAWCRAENLWPAYGHGVQLLDFPAYAKRSAEVEVSYVE